MHLMALFVALGGASYAAIKLPKNSVGAAQIKKNAVDSNKVKDRSLLATDFKSGQIPAGAKGETGAAGPAGPTASAYASNNINPNTSLTPGQVNFTVLDTTTPDAGTGTMTVTTRSRVVANATVSVYKITSSSGAAADVDCRIQGAGPGGNFSIGQLTRATLPPTVQGGAVIANVSLAGSVDVNPGQYGFQVLCQQHNGAGSTATPIYDSGDLTVIATGI